jgi:uncharacterized phiE125 gp8 family phage protein
MNYTQVTAPATEPISLEEAKEYLRVDHSVEDSLITAFIKAARSKVENDTWRKLITQTWKLSMDTNEVKKFVGVTGSPIQSISHVKYFDINVIQQTLSTGSYQANLLNEPAIIEFNPIPTMATMMNAMEIQFVCGYGVAASVPEDLKLAMKLLIGHWYEHRESVTVGNMKEIPMAYDALISPYRLIFYPYNN